MNTYKTIFILIVATLVSLASSAEIPDSTFYALYGDEQIKDSTEYDRYMMHYFNAQYYLQTGDYINAERQFSECQRIKKTAHVYYELSMIYSMIPRLYPIAAEHAKNAVNLSPQNVEYNEFMLNFYVMQNDFDNAISTLEKLSKIKPRNIVYLEQLSSLYDKIGKQKKSLECLNRIEKVNGYDELVIDYKLAAYTKYGKEQKFKDELHKAIEKFPYNVRYRVFLGDYYMRFYDYNKTTAKAEDLTKSRAAAFAEYTKAYSIDPNDGLVLTALGKYYEDTDSVKSDSLKLASVYSSQLTTEYKLQVLKPIIAELYEQGDTNKIIKIFEDLLTIYPEEYSIRSYYTEYLSQSTDTNRLVEQYRIMHKQRPLDEEIALKMLFIKANDTVAYYNFAKEQLDVFKNDTWRYYYNVGILIKNDSTEILYAIDSLLPQVENKMMSSQLYMIFADYFISERNDTNRCIALYDKALAKNPDNEYVLNNYAYFLYLRNENLSEAEDMIVRALEIKPLEATYLDTYACILFAKKDYMLARFYIEKAISQDPKEAIYMERYGDILYHLGDIDKAVEEWNKALKAGKDDETLKLKIKNKQYIKN